jgi:hypothetical protein
MNIIGKLQQASSGHKCHKKFNRKQMQIIQEAIVRIFKLLCAEAWNSKLVYELFTKMLYVLRCEDNGNAFGYLVSAFW